MTMAVTSAVKRGSLDMLLLEREVMGVRRQDMNLRMAKSYYLSSVLDKVISFFY